MKTTEPEYGEDVDTEIEISIKEAFFGVNKKVKLRTVNGKETSLDYNTVFTKVENTSYKINISAVSGIFLRDFMEKNDKF